MAVKGKPELKTIETISLFDPARNAYYEVEIDKAKAFLASLGLTPEEVDAKIEKLKEK